MAGHLLPMQGIAGSSPVCRSIYIVPELLAFQWFWVFFDNLQLVQIIWLKGGLKRDTFYIETLLKQDAERRTRWKTK